MAAAANFVIAMARLPAIAAYITPFEPEAIVLSLLYNVVRK
jgi:hypothetical protein